MAKNKTVTTPSNSKTLAEVVTISRQFLRSIRIDSDYGREDALSGYVCQGTARNLLESMATQIRDTKQRAFTWTGPYGGGKSSLALLLCSLVGPNLNLRKRAKEIIEPSIGSAISSAFDAKGDGWLVLPIVGKQGKVTDEIGAVLLNSSSNEGIKRRKPKKHTDVVGALIAAAEEHPQGVLIIIDELGKFLESAVHDGDDIYFFQELAEAASRTNGKLVVVGILHQSFEAYAARLGRQTRDDWAKVQGRFIDIPLVAGTDEVIELVSKAISIDECINHRDADVFSKSIANSIKNRRPGTPANIASALANCWPLHPVVASLLGPISRRRFSQNERSTFGFLASREPLGFIEFLQGSEVNWSCMYGPARYWDYLCANLETAIQASPDGHRWAVATEAVERAIAKGKSIHIELTKCVALIEMFRSGSGLLPELPVLEVCIQGAKAPDIANALRDLVAWKILIERKHLEAFGVFAGSDFDIEAAVVQARIDLGIPSLQHISSLADLQPILAKRLYHETGAMRWFSRKIVRIDHIEKEFETYKAAKGSVGTFVLCLTDNEATSSKSKHRLRKVSEAHPETSMVCGVPENAERIAELGLELVACEFVLKSRTELDGDSVARKELLGRLTTVRSSLEEELSDAFTNCAWYWRGRVVEGSVGRPISWIASSIGQAIYPRTPIIKNELVNRQDPSSNSKTARKALLYRMVNHHGKADLGYEGFSADAGLYFSIIKSARLYAPNSEGYYCFMEPSAHRNEFLYALWVATKHYLLKEGPPKKLSELYQLWSSAPYGMRDGVLPILGMAFFLANRSTLALYVDNAFTSDLSEPAIDEWLHDPMRIGLRYVSASSDQNAYLNAVLKSIPRGTIPTSEKPLDVARALVAVIVDLPNWTKRTTNLSAESQAIRTMLLKANDPHKVLFADLPTLLNASNPREAQDKLTNILREITDAYPRVLNQVLKMILKALDLQNEDYSYLKERAKAVKGLAGEFRLEAFVVRLETFDGSLSAIESLISLGNSKTPQQWIDRDIDTALLQLGTWAHDFRKAETLAPMRGRPSTRRALSVVFGGGYGDEVTATADIDSRDAQSVSELASKLLAQLQSHPPEIALAAIAESGARLFKNQMKREDQ